MSYRITAWSTTCNVTQQEIDLTEDVITNQTYAQQRADSFAARLNQQRFHNCADWVGIVQHIDTPITNFYGH